MLKNTRLEHSQVNKLIEYLVMGMKGTLDLGHMLSQLEKNNQTKKLISKKSIYSTSSRMLFVIAASPLLRTNDLVDF